MPKVRMLYRPFQVKKIYKDVHEEQILSALYHYKSGTVEEVISRIINTAVLEHMNLCIDSTIMQMLALNESLSQLFIENFETLIYNYIIYYLEEQGVEAIDGIMVEQIESLSKQIDMKTNLEEFVMNLEERCEANRST